MFLITTLLERYFLIINDINAVRDHYISTTFLAISVFLFCIKNSTVRNEIVAYIGRKYSTCIYILHPIFVSIFNLMISKLKTDSILKYLEVFIVYLTTLGFVIFMDKLNAFYKEYRVSKA